MKCFKIAVTTEYLIIADTPVAAMSGIVNGFGGDNNAYKFNQILTNVELLPSPWNVKGNPEEGYRLETL